MAFCGTSREHLAAAPAECAASDRVVGRLTDPTAVIDFFDDVHRQIDRIDILVNNACLSPKRRSPESWGGQIELDEWRWVIDINLTSAWLCSRAVVPVMMAGGWGRIVNIGSIAGRTTPRIAGPHYAAAKAGLAGLTCALAVDLAPYGITVNCLAPGWISSNMIAPADSETAREAAATIPVRRVGVPGDVAASVMFLVSNEASYVTAATIDVNGGVFAA